MSNQRRAKAPPAPYLPGDEHREVLSPSEPNEVVLLEAWRADHNIGMPEAIVRFIEAGLERLSQKPTRRGPKDVWADGRYLQLHGQVFEIMIELQAGRKSRVSVREAVEVLRERRPKLWRNAPSSLETRFYEAERRLKPHLAALEARMRPAKD
jgi:hypothetical protein